MLKGPLTPGIQRRSCTASSHGASGCVRTDRQTSTYDSVGVVPGVTVASADPLRTVETMLQYADAGSRSADDFTGFEDAWRPRPHPDTLAARETTERNFFHRPAAQAVCETRVVNDVAIADVDSVMQVAATWRDKVRTQRRFLA